MREDLKYQILEYNRDVQHNREIASAVEAAGGIRVDAPVQSDKLGFDLVRYYVNDILVKSEYVNQEIPMGTADHPIVWKPTMQLIQNAYYIHNSVRKVWMGAAGQSAEWDDPGFVEF